MSLFVSGPLKKSSSVLEHQGAVLEYPTLPGNIRAEREMRGCQSVGGDSGKCDSGKCDSGRCSAGVGDAIDVLGVVIAWWNEDYRLLRKAK